MLMNLEKYCKSLFLYLDYNRGHCLHLAFTHFVIFKVRMLELPSYTRPGDIFINLARELCQNFVDVSKQRKSFERVVGG